MARNRLSEFNPSRNALSGTLTVSGDLSLTGSVRINISGSNALVLGDVNSCSSSYGLEQESTSTGLALISKRTSGAENVSIESIADVNAATLNDEHIIHRFGWKDNSDVCHPRWDIKEFSIEADASSSAEVYGTAPDGGSSVGVYLGTTTNYTASGAKLVSVLNGSTEREYILFDGSRVFGSTDNGGYSAFKILTGSIQMVSGAFSDSTISIPAGTQVYAVGVRVTNRFPISSSTTFPADSTFQVGISASVGGFTEKWGLGIPTTQGSTNLTSSQKSGFAYYSVDTPVRIKSDIFISDLSASFGSGSVRIDIRYLDVNPPTS